MTNDHPPCPCGSGKESWWEYEDQDVPLYRVCEVCRANKLAHWHQKNRDIENAKSTTSKLTAAFISLGVALGTYPWRWELSLAAFVLFVVLIVLANRKKYPNVIELERLEELARLQELNHLRELNKSLEQQRLDEADRLSKLSDN
jgi:hypothetical protein